MQGTPDPLRHSVRLALAALALALSLAELPEHVSAWSTQTCRDSWDQSTASQTCTSGLTVGRVGNVQMREISVYCRRADGSLLYNQNVQESPAWVDNLNNCGGRLSVSC